MARTVVGLFDQINQAQNVVQELINAGFSRNDISISANYTNGEQDKSLNKQAGNVIKDGGTLVTVKADDDIADRAYGIMQRFGAVDLSEGGKNRDSSSDKDRSPVQNLWMGKDPSGRPTTSEVLDQMRDNAAN